MAALATACGPRLPDLPSAGGPPWRELGSMHFTMWTDAPVDEAREMLQRMEWLRSVIYGAVFPDLPAGGKTFVVVLRDAREASVFVPPYHTAYATAGPGNPVREPMIVMPSDPHGDSLLVTHELSHAISYNAVHDQPRWFAEGLATYFETIDLDMAKGTADVGSLRPEVKRGLEQHGLVPAARMFACARLSCTDDFSFYITAWAMFAYLRTEHPKELAAFEHLLGEEPASKAWREVFPDLDAAKLDMELRQFLVNGGLDIAHYTIEKRTWPIAVRVLGDADVHALRALLLHNRDRTAPAVATEVDAALALDPTNVLAQVMYLFVHHQVRSIEEARALTAAHPTDLLAWTVLASASDRGAEHEAAVAKACALMAENPAIDLWPACRRLPP